MTLLSGSVLSRRRGFTLVEVLVTTSLFSIVMSVLLVGVFSGTRAWDQADRHLERRVRVRRALEQFHQDVTNAQMGTTETAGVSADLSGRPIFRATTLETAPGSSWSGAMLEVEWSLADGPEGLSWTRKSQPLLGDEFVGSLKTDLMIAEVEALEIELRQAGAWIARADPEGPSPDLIRLTLEIKGGNDYQLILPLRPGESSVAPEDGEGGNGEEGEEGLAEGPDDVPGAGAGEEPL